MIVCFTEMVCNMVKVVNLNDDFYTKYVGRYGRGHTGEYGNPFVVGIHGKRGECVTLYAKWLIGQLDITKNIPLNGWPEKVISDPSGVAIRKLIRETISPDDILGCFCKPKPCHGNSIADFVNSGCQEPSDLSLFFR